MLSNIRYILLTALRDWLFFGLIAGVLFAVFISGALGETALLEPEQMVLSFSAAAARVIVVIGLIVFICFHVRSAFDSKEMDVLLSRPISRTNLVLSFAIGFACVALILILPVIAVIGYIGPMNQNGFIAWSVSVLLEAWLVVAIALFASLTLRSAVFSVLASLGIYAISRMMGFFIATTKSGVLFADQAVNSSLKGVIEFISLVVPRLDFFAKSGWLIYGLDSYNEIYRFLLQGGIFIALLLLAAIIDFRRRQF